jgi:hypothetical protein
VLVSPKTEWFQKFREIDQRASLGFERTGEMATTDQRGGHRAGTPGRAPRRASLTR